VPSALTPEERTRLDRVIEQTLVDLELEYEHPRDGAFFVKLPGEHKLATMTWLVVQDFSLLVEAFFMRKPAENEGGTYAFLLGRNARTYAVHFSIDRLGDIYLTGRFPLGAVTPDELDRILGSVRTYADENFDPALMLGFRGAIERERTWRAKLAREAGGKPPEGLLGGASLPNRS
jgi:Putative bacterial sensory transduction regulator